MANYHVVGVSHIDMAFVMRREAHAEMVEILLERIISVLERNPGVHFALEQAAHYRNLETRRPDLFRKVKELLKSGRLEFMGGMATTAETNFPNGECFVRNQGMGLSWLEEHLETKPHAGWLIDTFGLNPQVPQIMKQFGFQYLYANRFGGNKRFDIFQAEGLDQSRITIIGCDSNSINVLPETQSLIFCRAWGDVDVLFDKADRLKGDLPKLVTYYIENEEVLSEYYLRRTERKNINGSWLHSTYKEYEEALSRSGYVPPILKEELNPEFTGTFALRPSIKKENRKAENALLSAEKWQALLLEEEALEDCWWELFHCQFHDAFSGSCEDITHEDILKKLSGVQKKALEIQKKALRINAVEKGIVCSNSLPAARKEWTAVEGVDGNAAVYDGEKLCPSCQRDGRLYFLAEVPAGGIRKYEIREGKAQKEETLTGKREISNEFLRLVLSERNGIESLEDAQGNRYIAEAGNFLTVEEDLGGMQIEGRGGRELYAATGSISVDGATSDEMGQRIVMYGEFPAMSWNRDNKLAWKAEFALHKGESQLRLKLTLDWTGDSARIRLKLPFAKEGRDFYNEVPFGVIRREAYRNRPTAKGEWPAQRFAALENGSHGLALLNRGTAGVEQEGNILAATLIRAYGKGPDAWISPTPLSSGHGRQEFEFSIVPYTGNYRDAGIIEAVQLFDQPLNAVMGDCGLCGKERSFFELEGKGLVLSAIKKAQDGSGDIVVRIYEAEGRNNAGSFRMEGLREARSSSVKEKRGAKIPVQDGRVELEFRPYEIKTICLCIDKSQY